MWFELIFKVITYYLITRYFIRFNICTKKQSKISNCNFEYALLFKINLKNKDYNLMCSKNAK